MHAAKTGISYQDTRATGLRILYDVCSDQRKNDLIRLSDVVKNMVRLQELNEISDSDEEEAEGQSKRKRED